MKRARASLLYIAILVIVVAACSPSPKEQVNDFVKYMPEEIGPPDNILWERQDGDTVELKTSTITNKGHVTFVYEGPDDEIAFVVIEAYPSEDAAEVAYAERERALLLRGLEFSSDRAPRFATAQVTQDERVRYVLFLEETVFVEIDALAPDADALVSDELMAGLLDVVRQIYAKIAED